MDGLVCHWQFRWTKNLKLQLESVNSPNKQLVSQLASCDRQPAMHTQLVSNFSNSESLADKLSKAINQ
jgi:hypothetical protein